MPLGVMCHGSRSGRQGNPTGTEFEGTADYATHEPNGLGWTATIGDDAVAIHLEATEWAYHARGCSSRYVGVEFAQPTQDEAISDGQVRAFCWLFQWLRLSYPGLPLVFPTHAEKDGTPEYGPRDGKTDVFPAGDPRADELRSRILSRLADLGVR